MPPFDFPYCSVVPNGAIDNPAADADLPRQTVGLRINAAGNLTFVLWGEGEGEVTIAVDAKEEIPGNFKQWKSSSTCTVDCAWVMRTVKNV